jgi:hypothetical protein
MGGKSCLKPCSSGGAKATRLRLMILTVLSTTLLGVVGYGSAVHAQQAVDIDLRRSLVVTELAILSRFPLKRVMDQLVTQSGVAGLTSLDLFQQWWDTQNPAEQSFGHEPHCTGFLNGFPYTCRPAPSEGGQAAPLSTPLLILTIILMPTSPSASSTVSTWQ